MPLPMHHQTIAKAGAAIGTAMAPIAGTLAGCILVGIWGWFW